MGRFRAILISVFAAGITGIAFASGVLFVAYAFSKTVQSPYLFDRSNSLGITAIVIGTTVAIVTLVLTLRIIPAESKPWVGRFAQGFAGDQLPSGVYAWPDGVSMAVVSAGYGYVLKAAEQGKNWVRLQPMPITDVRVIADHKLIVFTDF